MSNVAWQIPLSVNPQAQSGPDMNKLQELVLGAQKIKQQQQEMQSQNALKTLFSDPANVDPATGLLKPTASAKLTQMNPTFGLQYNQAAAKVAETQSLTDLHKSDVVDKLRKAGVEMGEETTSFYESQLAKGIPPEQAAKNTQQVYAEHRQALADSGAFPPDLVKQIPPNFDYQRVKANLLTAKEKAELAEKEKADARADKRLADQEQHEDRLAGAQIAASNRATAAVERQGWELKDIPGADGKPQTVRINKDTGEVKQLTMPGGEPVRATSVPTGGTSNIVPDKNVLDFQTDQVLSGDASPIGAYSRNPAGREALLANVQKVASTRGISGADMAAIRAQFQGELQTERTIGSRVGAISVSGQEAKSMIPLAKEAFAKLPRDQFRPYNQLVSAVARGTNTPEQAAAQSADFAAITAYARALNPQGIPREADIAKGEQLLSTTGDSLESHNATLDQWQKEIEAIEKSTGAAKVQELNRIRGKNGLEPIGKEPETADKPNTLPPAALAQLEKGHVTTFGNGQKWTLGDDGQPKQVQ